MLLVVCGLPGTGKSRVARYLAEHFSAEWLRTDEIRRKMMKKPKYGKMEKEAVYEKLFGLAEKFLKEGKNVIMDATFYRRDLRERFREIAKRNGVFFEIVETKCNENAIRKRMVKRFKKMKRMSDADFGVYLKLKRQWQKVQQEHVVVDTTKGSTRAARIVARKIEMAEMPQSEIISKLMHKEPYPDKTGKIRMLQTHISYVMLTGKFAYKIKKQLKFSFLDFSTLEKRLEFCREELRLNKRLADGMYKAVVPIKLHRGKISIGGKGRTVEYALKMLEISQSRIMTNLLREGKVGEEIIGKITEQVVKFQKIAANGKKIGKFGLPKSIWENCVHPFKIEKVVEKEFGLGRKIREVKNKMIKFLRVNKGLFAKRIRERKIVEGHGDLHSGNIFIVGKKIYIFDAIEFSMQIRCIDKINEIAFFLMDLEFNKKQELANAFLERYMELTNDLEGLRLLPFYKAYRAIVRTMVYGLQISSKVPKAERNKARKLCKEYLELAYEYGKEF